MTIEHDKLIGTKYGCWTVIGGHPADTPPYPILMKCECVCGLQRYVRLHSLNAGTSTKCSKLCTDAVMAEVLEAGEDISKYDSLDKWTKKFGSDTGFTPGKATPCDSIPGSKNKIIELRRRLEAGEELFSDSDPQVVEDLTESARMDKANILNMNYVTGGQD